MRILLAAMTLLAATPALADKVAIESPDAPKAIGPYSQAIKSGKLMFVSGSLPFDPAGKIDYSKEDVSAQAHRAIDNIALELKAAGLGLDDVVSATVYVTDVDDFAPINAVYASYFHAPYPARTFVQVAKLLRGLGSSKVPWQRIVGAGGEIKLRGDAAQEQRFRLELEGVKFRGKRVNMELFEHNLRVWELPGR